MIKGNNIKTVRKTKRLDIFRFSNTVISNVAVKITIISNRKITILFTIIFPVKLKYLR